MKSGIYDITIENGSTYHINIEIDNNDGTAYDISDYTLKMQMRTRSDALILDCSNYMTLIGNNQIDLNIPGSATKDLKYTVGEYQISIDIAADSYSILRGAVEFTKAVTK